MASLAFRPGSRTGRFALGLLLIGALVVLGSSNGAPVVAASPERTVSVWVKNGERLDLHAGLFDRNGHFIRQRRRAGTRRLELRIREIPVPRASAGWILGAQYPRAARIDRRGRLIVSRELRGAIHIEVTRTVRPGERVSIEGLTIFQTLPALCEAVDVHDPAASGRSLAERGFTIRWTFVRDRPGRPRRHQGPTVSRRVKSPPEGTEIISISGPGGRYLGVPRTTRKLGIEVSPPGSRLGSRGSPHGPLDIRAECGR